MESQPNYNSVRMWSVQYVRGKVTHCLTLVIRYQQFIGNCHLFAVTEMFLITINNYQFLKNNEVFDKLLRFSECHIIYHSACETYLSNVFILKFFLYVRWLPTGLLLKTQMSVSQWKLLETHIFFNYCRNNPMFTTMHVLQGWWKSWSCADMSGV